eukprot:1193318-Prorocentrum_minimum.AAC.1
MRKQCETDTKPPARAGATSPNGNTGLHRVLATGLTCRTPSRRSRRDSSSASPRSRSGTPAARRSGSAWPGGHTRHHTSRIVSLGRVARAPPTNRGPSKGIYLTHRPIARAAESNEATFQSEVLCGPLVRFSATFLDLY